ncbi:efflux RND transporter permease subunit [Brevibacterium luteolum]|uniref:efflux RND transporter permease subunit n=1 Tax=Brevibacterium luteolum TaxID=199591 RepID=UPI00223C236C|nr:efflux RND transporter permease subunit [Brevibacterium luteolum]MCT1874384.1 efflux RND transporter permease subunit [Brevibacterium luteolum]MCT1889615.1 efflux RND transporter permease subunit [Brevibacterium luteolum]MCT1893272.1 efflux RND transporter permease subunit [Brevibacterium luteolum]MCT1922938.1 efflux RND transporter permease subunit [Brevibacterium luteolum]
MNLLTRVSLRNRALIALISVIAIGFGLIATAQMKKELFPDLQMPQAFVTTSYDGASPEAVEKEVTEPLEAALNNVAEVEKVSSVSMAGSSQVIVETKYGTSSDEIVRQLQRAVSQAQPQLPDGSEPEVFSASTADIPIAMLTVTGSDDPEALAQELDDVAVPELKRIDGVRAVDVTGAPVKEVSIEADEDKLEDEGLSPDALAGILQANGIPTSAGDLVDEGKTTPVSVGARLTSVDEIANLALPGKDEPVLLKDVATVELREADTQSISRTNGEPALSLMVMKKPDGNIVEISDAVAEELPQLKERMSENVEFHTVFDQAPFIKQSIDDLVGEGVFGLIFAVLVILVFLLSVRATIITAISIPLSLLVTLLSLWLSGYSLNMLTLAALTISIGRVVDDSIVVIEAIRRRHAQGGTKFTSIMGAVSEVAGAITASTLTTMAVFVPMIFVSGQTGEMFRPFALTAAIALASSLLVALTIVPVLAYWFLRARESRVKLTRAQKQQIRADRKANLRQWKAERKAARKRPVSIGAPAGRHATSELPIVGESAATAAGGTAATTASGTATGGQPGSEVDELAALRSPVTRLQKTYVPFISASTKHPVITLIIAVLVLAGTVFMIPQLKTELFPDTGQDFLQVEQSFEAGSSLEESGEQAAIVEDVFEKYDEIESYQLSIGDNSMGGDAAAGTHLLNLKPGTSIKNLSAKLEDDFEDLDGAGELNIMSEGGGMSSDIEVTVTGSDTDKLATASEDIADAVRDLDEVQSVTTDLEATQPTLEVDIDRKKAAEEGLDEATVGQVVQRAMNGQQIGNVVIDNLGHRVVLHAGDVSTVGELEDLEIPVTAQAAGGAGASGTGQDGTSDMGQDTGAGMMPGAPAPAPAPEPETVKLSEIAEVNRTETPAEIRHTEGQRSVTVTITPAGNDLGAASQAVQKAAADVDTPQGVTVDFGGATAEQQEAFTQMGLALLAAILITFVILVATFKSLLQPLILLVSIPFAATGSIGLSLLTDTPLGMTSMVGLLMLVGIVVTNAIVLIDLINHFRRHGVELRTAIIHGARLRYRPILMTAAATIFALVPMALGISGEGMLISKPLAIVVIGGLVSSTLLTLILVPVLYLLLESVKERRTERRVISDMTRSHVIDQAEAEAEQKKAAATASASGGSAAGSTAAGEATGETRVDASVDVPAKAATGHEPDTGTEATRTSGTEGTSSTADTAGTEDTSGTDETGASGAGEKPE